MGGTYFHAPGSGMCMHAQMGAGVSGELGGLTKSPAGKGVEPGFPSPVLIYLTKQSVCLVGGNLEVGDQEPWA